MVDDHSRIPVCKSDFLQDVSIELGKRLKSLRSAAKGERLEFRASASDQGDYDLECFDVVRTMGQGEYIQVVVCEDGQANFMYRQPMAHKHDTARYEGYIISVATWTPYEVADLVRSSLLNEEIARETWRKYDRRKRS